LDTPVLSHLLYLSVSLVNVSATLRALVDCGSSINIIHESTVSSYKLPVRSCVGPKVTLADGKTTLHCDSYVTLSYIVAGILCQDTFFVARIGAQAMILGMPFLEWVNSVID